MYSLFKVIYFLHIGSSKGEPFDFLKKKYIMQKISIHFKKKDIKISFRTTKFSFEIRIKKKYIKYLIILLLPVI